MHTKREALEQLWHNAPSMGRRGLELRIMRAARRAVGLLSLLVLLTIAMGQGQAQASGGSLS
jgi:hypothetical protein